MAYDEQLAARISDLMHARPGVVERKMFGGMGWTIGGNMAVGVMRERPPGRPAPARGDRGGDPRARTCTSSAARAPSR